MGLTRSEFEAGLRSLTSAHARATTNVGCLACERCERCTESTFCTDSKWLTRCAYCANCSDCSDSTHCRRSLSCFSCNHCDDCERCTGCAYVGRSIACSGCTYCFGCVALVKKDFHILNEPYDRQTYFAIVKQLTSAGSAKSG